MGKPPQPQPADSAPDRASVQIDHDRAQINLFVRQLLGAAARHGYSEASCFALRLAVEEALSNAFRHGHKGLPDSAAVRAEYRVNPAEIEVTIEDRGPGFDPKGVPDPTLDENLELPSGRGLMLMRAYMASVSFNPSGNRVTLVYRRPPDPPGR